MSYTISEREKELGSRLKEKRLDFAIIGKANPTFLFSHRSSVDSFLDHLGGLLDIDFRNSPDQAIVELLERKELYAQLLAENGYSLTLARRDRSGLVDLTVLPDNHYLNFKSRGYTELFDQYLGDPCRESLDNLLYWLDARGFGGLTIGLSV